MVRLGLTGRSNCGASLLSSGGELEIGKKGKSCDFSTPGVDVMITIFCDFRQFLAKNWRFSQKPMLRSNFC
jgi:hypothetical protein